MTLRPHYDRVESALVQAILQRIPITHLEEVTHTPTFDGPSTQQTKVMNGSHVYADIVTLTHWIHVPPLPTL